MREIFTFRRILKTICLPVIILISWAPGNLSAHEMWLEKRPEGLVLSYGHTGATHEDVANIPYDPQEVKRIACYDINGIGGEFHFKPVYPVIINDFPAVTYVLMSSGYWTETAFGTKRQPKNEAKGALTSWLSYESVKRLDSWSEKLAQPVTVDIELSPLEDPFELTEGDKVSLLVTINGKPKSGIPVAYDDDVRGTTDEDGRINIRLKHDGRQMIRASYTEPGDGIKTDEIRHTTTLMFEIEDEE